MGIVISDCGARTSVRELMHNADRELYKVKRKGRNSYSFFHGAVNE